MLRSLYGECVDELLEEIRSAYGLEWVRSNLSHIASGAAPKWWFGQTAGAQFGIREFGRTWEVTVGKIPAVVDLELTRADLSDGIALDDYVEPSHRLAQRFRITRAGVSDAPYLGPQLAAEGVADNLGGVSPAVVRLGVHRNGVELDLDREELCRAAFDDDLLRAARATLALQAYADAHPVLEAVEVV